MQSNMIRSFLLVACFLLCVFMDLIVPVVNMGSGNGSLRQSDQIDTLIASLKDAREFQQRLMVQIEDADRRFHETQRNLENYMQRFEEKISLVTNALDQGTPIPQLQSPIAQSQLPQEPQTQSQPQLQQLALETGTKATNEAPPISDKGRESTLDNIVQSLEDKMNAKINAMLSRVANAQTNAQAQAQVQAQVPQIEPPPRLPHESKLQPEPQLAQPPTIRTKDQTPIVDKKLVHLPFQSALPKSMTLLWREWESKGLDNYCQDKRRMGWPRNLRIGYERRMYLVAKIIERAQQLLIRKEEAATRMDGPSRVGIPGISGEDNRDELSVYQYWKRLHDSDISIARRRTRQARQDEEQQQQEQQHERRIRQRVTYPQVQYPWQLANPPIWAVNHSYPIATLRVQRESGLAAPFVNTHHSSQPGANSVLESQVIEGSPKLKQKDENK